MTDCSCDDSCSCSCSCSSCSSSSSSSWNRPHDARVLLVVMNRNVCYLGSYSVGVHSSKLPKQTYMQINIFHYQS